MCIEFTYKIETRKFESVTNRSCRAFKYVGTGPMSVRSDSVRVLCAKPKHDDDLVDPLIVDEVSQKATNVQ